MPKFKFQFRRTYTITEGFDREIEAETAEEAQLLADAVAVEANSDSPDDVCEDERGFTEFSSYTAEMLDNQGRPVLLCMLCQEPQFPTPSGITCKNGHGGA